MTDLRSRILAMHDDEAMALLHRLARALASGPSNVSVVQKQAQQLADGSVFLGTHSVTPQFGQGACYCRSRSISVRRKRAANNRAGATIAQFLLCYEFNSCAAADGGGVQPTCHKLQINPAANRPFATV